MSKGLNLDLIIMGSYLPTLQLLVPDVRDSGSQEGLNLGTCGITPQRSHFIMDKIQQPLDRAGTDLTGAFVKEIEIPAQRWISTGTHNTTTLQFNPPSAFHKPQQIIRV